MKTQTQVEIPFQLQMVIDGMRNKRETDHIRGNYRLRLEGIRKAIDSACNEFDKEMGAYNTTNLGLRK